MTKSDLPRVLEAGIQKAVVQLLEIDGWRAFRTEHAIERTDKGKVRRKVGEVGMPDYLFLRYLGFIKGRFFQLATITTQSSAETLWIEFKAPGEKPSPAQKLWHKAERERGALVLVVDSTDAFLEWYRASGLARRVPAKDVA